MALLIGTSSCSGIQKAKKLESKIVKENKFININNKQNGSLYFQYIGCGGFLLRHGNNTILVDPYFSNIGPLFFIPFKKLQSDTTLIDQFFAKNFGLPKDEKGLIKFVLIAHSHYDHLADLPSIYHRNLHCDSTQILGSKTTKNLLYAANLLDVIEANDEAWTKGKKVYWFYSQNRRIRVLPIRSEHAPHFCGIKVISSKKIQNPVKVFPNKASKLPEGTNFNFLIDFLDESGQIAFRIFSQASSCSSFNIGFPPKHLIEEKQIDLALLCVANFNQVKNYPQQLIDYINPKQIILTHWENFFRPIEKLMLQPATVPGTNVVKFIKQLEKKLNQYSPPIPYVLPNPLVSFEIH